LLLLPALLSATLAIVVRPYRRVVGWSNAVFSLVAVGAALELWRRVLGGAIPSVGDSQFLRVDALSALLAACVSFVAALAAWLGPGLTRNERYGPAEIRRFRIFINAFTLTMLFAVTTNNVAFMWIAIEATTITSAVLIPLHRTKASVEASWKYLLIGSVGIALAFAGTVLAYFDFITSAGPLDSALNWTVLVAAAPSFHPQIIRLAFVFLLVGYGTKAGLAPMHTWLPDAHSEAPAPLSAMMSGVLLAVAIYAIVRWKIVVNAVTGAAFTSQLLIIAGLLSLAIAAFSLVIQRNYKRMLAYSSVEHTGLISLGLALGPAGVFAAMLHLLNHAVAKSMLFLLAGRVLHRYQTTEIAKVSGMMRVLPWTGALMMAGILAIVGLPPFGLFLSEILLVRAGFAAGRVALMSAVLALLAVTFVALLTHLNRMSYGEVPAHLDRGEHNRWALVPLSACVLLLLALGLTVPGPVERLLKQIGEIAGR
jgi:hydrogenase-4 component F